MGCQSCKPVVNKEPVTDMVTEEDGSLLFGKIAPTMKGYVHDPSNPNRLKPDNTPCVDRLNLPVIGQGIVWVMSQCNQIGCPTRGQTVDEIVCSDCPFRRTKR